MVLGGVHVFMCIISALLLFKFSMYIEYLYGMEVLFTKTNIKE